MRAILISDKPKWCALMMNGEKTIEVRKNKALAKATQKLIDEYGYAEIYVYCTKEEDIARIGRLGGDEFILERYPLTEVQFKSMNSGYSAKGKVVFKFRCYKVRNIIKRYIPKDSFIYSSSGCLLSQDSCLSYEELDNYLKSKIGETKGYAIHISDLEIFDKPKELSEFKRCAEKICIFSECHKYMHCLKPLTKAPQNFCYVEVEQ